MGVMTRTSAGYRGEWPAGPSRCGASSTRSWHEAFRRTVPTYPGTPALRPWERIAPSPSALALSFSALSGLQAPVSGLLPCSLLFPAGPPASPPGPAPFPRSPEKKRGGVARALAAGAQLQEVGCQHDAQVCRRRRERSEAILRRGPVHGRASLLCGIRAPEGHRQVVRSHQGLGLHRAVRRSRRERPERARHIRPLLRGT